MARDHCCPYDYFDYPLADDIEPYSNPPPLRRANTAGTADSSARLPGSGRGSAYFGVRSKCRPPPVSATVAPTTFTRANLTPR